MTTFNRIQDTRPLTSADYPEERRRTHPAGRTARPETPSSSRAELGGDDLFLVDFGLDALRAEDDYLGRLAVLFKKRNVGAPAGCIPIADSAAFDAAEPMG